jgi:hypothetical protein
VVGLLGYYMEIPVASLVISGYKIRIQYEVTIASYVKLSNCKI